METLGHDIRYALRTLRRNLSITVLAIASLSLAIAGNTTVFSVVNAMLYRPLPYEEPHRIAILGERAKDVPRGQITPASAANFLDWQERQTSFSQLAAFRNTAFSLDRGGDVPEQVTAGAVSPGFFAVLGADAAEGRVFRPEEADIGRHRVALLSHGFYSERYAADEPVVGETLKMNGEPFEVVGVLPADFEFIDPTIQLYVPLAMDRANLKRHQRTLIALGRLAPGVEDATAQAEMSAIMVQLEEQYPESNRGFAIDVLNLREEIPDRRNRLFMNMLQGALIFVLLIACANIANLLLSRSQKRDREIAIRNSIGANRRQIITQLLIESLMMSMIAGAIGLGLAALGVSAIGKTWGSQLPSFYTPVIDNRVMLFNLAVTLFGALLFGLAPVLQMLRVDLVTPLKDGTHGATAGGRRRWVSKALVVAELALALVFLGGASVMLKSFETLQSSDPGFRTADLLMVQLGLPTSAYESDERKIQMVDQLSERLGAMPGVEGVIVSNTLPRTIFVPRDIFTIDGEPAAEQPPRAAWLTANPEYFETLDIPLQRGRLLSAADGPQAEPVAVINAALAARYWPEGEALGQRLTILGSSRRIVGVVADVRHGLAINNDFAPTVYLPFKQHPSLGVSLGLRLAATSDELGEQVRRQVQAADPNIAIAQITTLDAFVDQFWAGQRVFSVILRAFGGLALLLAAIGIYGVLAYSVTQRTHEIGVRMAVGADRNQVLRMVLFQGLRLAAVGVALGVPGVILVNKGVAAVIAGFVPVESGPIFVGGAVLVLVTIIASLVPALRAASVDPIRALRWE